MVIRMKHEELEQILNDIDLTKEAPAQEPQRQYYYMKRARQIVAQQEEVLGHRPTACAVTFGCQMNAKDSEKLIGILETIGYEMIEDESADLVFYNTCTVRDNANQRIWQTWFPQYHEKEESS